jgi:RNA polymerase sigma-70 factor (ECF subfamily)
MAADSASRTGSVLLLLLNNPKDAQSWNAFVDRYAPKIYGWCRQRGLQEADAEDVTQEVLTQLVHKLQKFRYEPDKGSFRAWLKTLTHHAWCDYLESRRRASGSNEDPDGWERLQAVEAREDLLQALADTFDLELLAEAQARVQLLVSPRDWKIFEDLALGGRSGPAVAHELSMTVTAVLMAKSRVQKKLGQEIQRLESDRSSGHESLYSSGPTLPPGGRPN